MMLLLSNSTVGGDTQERHHKNTNMFLWEPPVMQGQEARRRLGAVSTTFTRSIKRHVAGHVVLLLPRQEQTPTF
jgi:hypothetical protein